MALLHMQRDARRIVEAAVPAAMSSQAIRPPAGRTRPVASLPLQSRSIDHHDFSLVWPLVRGSHKASADRIVPHVVPFLGVTFVAAQNVIKKVHAAKDAAVLAPHTSPASNHRSTMRV